MSHRTATTIATCLLVLSADRAFPGVPRVIPNHNLHPAGTLVGKVLSVRLEVRAAQWRPSADNGRSIPVHAFAEVGHPPQIPGPLIRVPLGTEIRATIHNALADSTLRLFGLVGRGGSADDALEVPPGATRTVRLTPAAVGTLYYWGTTTHATIASREWLDSQLAGAFIVDPPGATPRDRVFVLGTWFRNDTVARPGSLPEEVMTINGKSWPHTERLTTRVADSVVWRWINPTISSHPMHLHGVYFRLASRGDWRRDTLLALDRQPLEVTELMLSGGTMTMRWAAAKEGNWLFHCHFAFHASQLATVDPAPSGSSHPDHAFEHGMGGLVLGIHASARPGPATASPAAPNRRRLRLLVQSAPARFGVEPGLGYVLEGAVPPARDSIRIPGAPIVLTRGEPVRITVVNTLTEPTAVHWHGMELESYPDGVPGWSGSPARLLRSIAPGDSFAAEFTPPRAGTFIYHSHFHETRQIGLGLYGPLIVLEPGQRYDPETDRIVVVGLAGSSEADSVDTAPGLINGQLVPPPMELRAGVRYRFRLINIDPDQRVGFALMRDSVALTWRPIAKDGADLPPALTVTRRAELMTGPGETADFEIAPVQAGDMQLRISAPFIARPWTAQIPLRVK